MASEIDEQISEIDRFRYAAGFVIQNQGTEIVERLIRDGTKTRFGIRESRFPFVDLEGLNRREAENFLREREWKFHNYPELEVGTVAAKIFDTHVLFSASDAFEVAQKSLNDMGEDVRVTGDLDADTVNALEDMPSEFLDAYVPNLENFVDVNHDGRSVLLKRVRLLPSRNVNTINI